MRTSLSKHSPENVPATVVRGLQAAPLAGCVWRKRRISSLNNRDETAVHFFKQPETARGNWCRAARHGSLPLRWAIGNDGVKFADTGRNHRYRSCHDRMLQLQPQPPLLPPRYTRANTVSRSHARESPSQRPESEKDTRHFELDLTGWGLSFEVGAIHSASPIPATNDPELVRCKSCR